MKNKYNINNFYVGELYLSREMGNSLINEKLNEKDFGERDKVTTICANGAINFDKHRMSKYTDYDNKCQYKGVLTIFYKENDEYICLHNQMAYDSDSIDFYDNLIPLGDLLPKVDFSFTKEISAREALKTFDSLFKSNAEKTDKLYNKIEHPMQEYYVGNLNLYEGFLPDNNRRNRYQYSNLPQKYVLYISDAVIMGIYGLKGKTKDEYGLVYDSHDTTDFRCLFLKQKNGLYNIHNYQTYDKGILQQTHFDGNVPLGESYYDWIIPFENYLEQRDVRNNYSSLTIPKALKLYRKANN